MSVKCVNYDETNDTCTHILIPHERAFILVFQQEEWLVGATNSTGNFGPTDPVGAKTQSFNRHSLVAPQP